MKTVYSIFLELWLAHSVVWICCNWLNKLLWCKSRVFLIPASYTWLQCCALRSYMDCWVGARGALSMLSSRSIWDASFVIQSSWLQEGQFAGPVCIQITELKSAPGGGGGGDFKNFWVGMCRWDPGTLEPLVYIRASSAEFCYPILE